MVMGLRNCCSVCSEITGGSVSPSGDLEVARIERFAPCPSRNTPMHTPLSSRPIMRKVLEANMMPTTIDIRSVIFLVPQRVH